MESLEAKFTAATTPGPDRQTTGVVLIAADNTGQITYSNAFGSTSIVPEEASPMTADNTFWIASCTKLITTVAALQCVEKGLLSLDDEISNILPEWKTREVLTGFDEKTGEPVLKESTKKMTLRHLLSHSSGMAYDFIDPLLLKWRGPAGSQTFEGDIMKRYMMPLVFEPGSGWTYSCGIDWAGLMVARVNGGIRLGEYLKTHIFEPLGMPSTTFHVARHQSVLDRLCKMTTKNPDGELVAAPPVRDMDPKDDLGGGGLFTCPNDYIKVLISLLKNDGLLLKKESVEMMFQSGLEGNQYIQEALAHSVMGPMYRSAVESSAWTFGLGGIVNLEDVPGVCKKGTMTWSGLPNLYWWIDPSSGTCGMYASQLMPPCETTSMELALTFRRYIFEGVGK